MAEIPVEKKTSPPWWVWLVAALIIIALIWWFAEAADEPDDVAVIPPVAEVGTATPAVPGAAGTEITDPVIIVAVPDRRPLVGQTVRLTGVPVLDVIGDQAFWIGPSPDQRVLVAMKEVPPAAGGPTDAAININPGQTINLIGDVRAMPAMTGPDLERTEMVFGQAFAEAAENEQVYIFARTATVTDRP